MINTDCNEYLRSKTEGFRRTCKECGLGPCKHVVEKENGMSGKLKPISTAPKNRWILLAGDSGYSTTPLRFEAGKFDTGRGYWVTHSNDAFTDGGPEPEYWMEIPQVEQIRKTAEEWLQEPEHKGIIVLENWALISDQFYTAKEFQEKLLNSRVQVSGGKLKELLNKK